MADDRDELYSLPRDISDDLIDLADNDDERFDRFVTYRHRQSSRAASAPPASRIAPPSGSRSVFADRRSPPPSTIEPDRSTTLPYALDNSDNTADQQCDESLGELLDTIAVRLDRNVHITDVCDHGTQSDNIPSVTRRNHPDRDVRTLVTEALGTMDSTFAPKPFKGQVGEDVETFLQEFDKYVEYRELHEEKVVALLKLLLKEGAGEWLGRLDINTRNNADALRRALLERYGRSKVVKHKTARELFARKQGADEDVETFISACVKLSTSFGAEAEAMAMYAIMGGLRRDLSTFVAQRQPENLKQLIEQARLAEMTTSPTSDQPVIQQLSEMKAELQRLGSKFETATTAQVRASSPSGTRRVHFDDAPRTSPSNNYYRPRGGSRGGGNFQQQRRQWNEQQQQPSAQSADDQTQARGDCTRCGRQGGHDHPNRCRAINLSCFYCTKVGHTAKCCFKAKRDRQIKDQRQQ